MAPGHQSQHRDQKAFQKAPKRHLITGEVGRDTTILDQSCGALLFELKQITDQSTIDLNARVPAFHPDDDDLEQTLLEISTTHHGLASFLNHQSPQTLKRIRISYSKWFDRSDYTVSPHQCIATATAQHALQVSLLGCCSNNDTVPPCWWTS